MEFTPDTDLPPLDATQAPAGYRAVPCQLEHYCDGCGFEEDEGCGRDRPCTPSERPDRQQVIFVPEDATDKPHEIGFEIVEKDEHSPRLDESAVTPVPRQWRRPPSAALAMWLAPLALGMGMLPGFGGGPSTQTVRYDPRRPKTAADLEALSAAAARRLRRAERLAKNRKPKSEA